MKKKSLKNLSLKKVIVSGLQKNVHGGVDTGNPPGSMKLGGTCDGGGSFLCVTSHVACDHICATEDGNDLCT
jgi:hypothetical protein